MKWYLNFFLLLVLSLLFHSARGQGMELTLHSVSEANQNSKVFHLQANNAVSPSAYEKLAADLLTKEGIDKIKEVSYTEFYITTQPFISKENLKYALKHNDFILIDPKEIPNESLLKEKHKSSSGENR